MKFYGFVALLSMIAFGTLMQSCDDSNDSAIFTMLDREEANKIAAQYLEIANNQYVLNLSEEGARALGISKLDYSRIQADIILGNTFIQENGLEAKIAFPSIHLRSCNEENACSFKMQGTGMQGSASVFIPINVSRIRISLISACFFATAFGNVLIGGQRISYSIWGISGGSTTVSLPLSNTHATINGHTMCSDGGTITVHLIYN